MLLRQLVGVTQQYVGEVGIGSTTLTIQGVAIEGRTLIARGGTPPYAWGDVATGLEVGTGPEYVIAGGEVGHIIQLSDNAAGTADTAVVASATLPADPLVWFGRGDIDITDVSGKSDGWRDNSANETDAVAAGETNRPTIVSNWNGSGRKALEFIGSSDQMIVSVASVARSAYSVYLAVQITAASPAQEILGPLVSLDVAASENFIVSEQVSPYTTITSTGGEGAVPSITHFVWENDSGANIFSLYVNNTLIGSVTSGTGTFTESLLYLASSTAEFTIGELLIYETLHTPLEQSVVHNYLRDRWL